jgi:signal transduction histidine kinase
VTYLIEEFSVRRIRVTTRPPASPRLGSDGPNNRPGRLGGRPIRLRLVAIVLLIVSIGMVASVYLVTVRARDDADRQATIYATELAGRYGDEVDKTVGNALRTARDVAGTMVALNSSHVTDRGTYDRVLLKLLEAHPDYLGTWAVFAPNALDRNDARYANTSQSDATGRYIPYWNRGSGKVEFVPCMDYETPGIGDYYVIPKRTGEEKVIDPYVYPIDGKPILMATVAVPVFFDGVFAGVTGIDFRLSTLGASIAALHPYQRGYAALLSSGGLVVSHPDRKAIGKPAADFPATKQLLATFANTAKGSNKVLRDSQTGAMSLQLAVPVKLSKLDTWMLVVSVPLDAVHADAARLLRLTAIVSGVGLLFVGIVLGTGRARALRLVKVRTAQLREAQSQLVDSARQAGMAEIATNVLHNVGNVLNSVNVSANLVCQKVRGSKSAGLSKAVVLMHEHEADLGDFLTTDARGKALPAYLDKLAVALAAERESIDEELQRLTNGVEHIKEIVSAQQSLAGVSRVIESVNMNDVVDDALRMAGVQAENDLTVVRDSPDVPLVSLDRHRVLLILLNLITNAMHATKDNVDRPRELRLQVDVAAGQAVSITVADNGVGISAENLKRIFVHGFTTHADGHGFGLHSSALAAKEMGGTLTVHTEGDGTGAAFTLDVQLDAEEIAA